MAEVVEVGAMSKSDVISWAAFGLVFGLIVGFAGNGGILSSIEKGVVTGELWAIFGLVAGSLHGLWAGRAVSARRLKGIGPLLPADTSTMLALADGDIAPQNDHRPVEPLRAEPDRALQPRGARSLARGRGIR